MTASTTIIERPVVRRRLWPRLVGMAFLILIGAGWWWSQRPKADMRYVGTWELVYQGVQPRIMIREVHWANGMGGSLQNGKITTRFCWSGDDTTFIHGQHAGGPPLLAHLVALKWKYIGGPRGWLYDVHFVSPDEIRLTPRTPGSGMEDVTFLRVKSE